MNPLSNPVTATQRRPYSTPVLSRHGALRELTLSGTRTKGETKNGSGVQCNSNAQPTNRLC